MLFSPDCSKNIFAKKLFEKIILLAIFFTPLFSAAQTDIENTLIRNFQDAKSDTGRIHSLSLLADYYFANKDFKKGDSVIERQIMLAEASLDEKLILSTLFGNPGYNYTHTYTRDRLHSTRDYITKALNYAKSAGLTDYVAMANANFAALYNADGKSNEAFWYANLGFTTALNTNNDSAKVICALELGYTYQQKSNILMAFKTYTNANDIASQEGNEKLQPLVFQYISAMYKKLGKNEIAKNYLFRGLQVNKKLNNIKGQIEDYIALAKVVDYMPSKEYLTEAINLSETTNNFLLAIEAQKILYSYMMVMDPVDDNIRYLNKNNELKNYFSNTGPGYLNWILGETYLYGKRPDTAINYYINSEKAFNEGYDLTTKKNFFGELADCYKSAGNVPLAINYYEKAISLCKSASDLRAVKSHAGTLRALYSQQSDYKKAFESSIIYDRYKDSVDMLSKENELTLIELDNETKRIKQEQELAKERERRRHNLQYMGITIIVATVFVFLIVIGMFRVSKLTIRTMGFFSLIFLFEFIVLVLDAWIHHITHGEPMKVWLIKIGIISILFPLHHYIEERLIHYLLSRKLITIRNRISLQRWLSKQKKSSSGNPEEDDVSNEILD